MRATIYLSASALAIVLGAGSAQAAICMWNGGNGLWTTASGWSCTAVPGQTDDVTIAGTGALVTLTASSNQKINSLTIGAGSGLTLDGIGSNTTLSTYSASHTVNGTITLSGANSYLRSTTANSNMTASWGGMGAIRLAGGTFYAERGMRLNIGSSLTVAGFGAFGNDASAINNAGLIHANGTGILTINPTGGRTGLVGSGLGTGGNVTFLNSGTLRATRTVGTSGLATLSLAGGLYENDDSSVMEALASGQLAMATDANLLNLGATGVLDKGIYRASLGGILTLRSFQGTGGTAVEGITAIGTAATSTDTIVELSGDTSRINVASTGTIALAGTLMTIARSGQLIIGGGANFNPASNAFQVLGKLTLGNAAGQAQVTLKQAFVQTTGEISGFGTLLLSTALSNAGTLRASGGTLAIASQTTFTPTIGGTGTFASDSGATLSLSGVTNTAAMTIGTLVNNGSLALGNRNITVTTDYQNAGFGTGAAFNRLANVTTSAGQIDAAAGGSYRVRTATGGEIAGRLELGGIRIGDLVPLARIENTSTIGLTIRGAAFGDDDTRYTLDNASWALAPGATSVVNLTALNAGALTAYANVSTNFRNLSAAQFQFNTKVYQPGIARAQAASIDFGSFRVGDTASQTFTFGNIAPAISGYSETLATTATITGQFRIGGGTNLITSPIAAQGSATSPLSMLTTTAGALTGTMTLGHTSQAVTGSGLANLNLAGQSVALTGRVYQIAIAAGQPGSIALAARRVGDSAASAVVTLGNTAPNVAGYTEALISTASVGSGNFRIGGGSSFTSGAIASGASTASTLTLLTAAAGNYSTTLNIANTSKAIAGSGLSDLALAGKSVTVTGKVYAPALAQVSALAVDLGYVRPGEAKAGSVTLTNGATGALTDRLVTSASGSNGFNAGTAADLTQGQSAVLGITFGGSATSGVKTGAVDLAFNSRNPDMADLALAGKQVSVTATVTELAKASLFKAGGSGTLTGSGTSYTLNLGNVWYKAGTVTTNFGLKNDIAATSYGEKLGGSWTALSGSNAYSFSAEAVGLINSGASIEAGVLSFMTSGKAFGQYLSSFKFTPTTNYNGLTPQQQEQVQVNIIANLVGVPEPAMWLQMIAGFGLVGGVVRRRRNRVPARTWLCTI